MKITDEYYVEYVEKCWKQHEDAMRDTHKLWKEEWQLYQSKQDWSDKQGWQSKCFIPKTLTTVERAAGEVKRAVFQTEKLFKFQLNDAKEQEQIQQLEEASLDLRDAEQLARIQQQIKLIKRRIDVRKRRMQMRERQFKQTLSETNFAGVYSEMMKPCCLLGVGIPKVIWDTGKDGLKFEHVDAMNFAISPDFVPYQKDRAPFMIERMEESLASFRSRTKKNKNWKKKEIKKIEEDAKKLDRFHDARIRKGYGDYTDINKKVELKYFYGDVIDKNEDKVEENMLLVVANGKYLVRKHENPFDHQRQPYIPTIPIVYPHRGTHGTSMVQPIVRIQYAINNIVNMIMDNLNFSVTRMFEYNPDDLMNPSAMNAIYPGKTIPVNTLNGAQAIREVTVSSMKRDILYFYELLERERQEATSITEYNTGLPGKKSKTLGEIELKTAESRGLFDTIGRDLELNSLKPLLEMAYDLCSQFKGWERREGNYTFVVSGLTVMLMQRELSQQIGQILGMALQSPILNQMTDVQDLWKQFLATYNLSNVYKDPMGNQQPLMPEQKQALQQKAEQDAKATIQRMSPEQRQRLMERAQRGDAGTTPVAGPAGENRAPASVAGQSN